MIAHTNLDLLFDGLLDDEALVHAPEPRVPAVVAEHQQLRAAHPNLLATLVVPDHRLTKVSQQVLAGESVPVSVITSGGAGGLLALTRRDIPGVDIVSAEPALRDLDDLAGSALRVVSAAAELGPDVAVYVDLPYAPGWAAAVEQIEAAGLYAKIAANEADPGQHVEQLSILIEADLAFKITQLSGGCLPLLAAVNALVDGAGRAEAAQLLQPGNHDQISSVVSAWDQATQARIRRQVRRLGADRVQEMINERKASGVAPPPSN
jgi:hypothetical protein